MFKHNRGMAPGNPAAEKPRHFRSRAAFRAWLARHHASAPSLQVAFWKAHTGKNELTYEQAVEEALCFGWIDGVVNRIDEDRYQHRFTPRRKRSIWSAVNLAKVARLKAAGLMAPAGIAAFEDRDPSRANLYSNENPLPFSPAIERSLRAKRKAWAYFAAQPPGYRRLVAHWVMSAKRDETRERRVAQLIAACAEGRRLR
jgi:uncharacterized protein YdeI (YjbR/CyaY-like superfamily)